MKQFPTLRCQSHPGSVICSVQVSQKCSIESRLACVKCMMKHKSMENYIEINDFLTSELVLLGLKDVMDCNQVPMQIFKSQQRHLKMVDDFVKDIVTQILEFRQKLIERLDLQLDNLKTIEELRIQYDNALQKLQEKYKQVSELDTSSKSKVRIDLEKCVESYVSLFYKADNQIIQDKIMVLGDQQYFRVGQQMFDDFKITLANPIDKLYNQFSICKLLTDTQFVNEVLGRVTVKRTKSMNLIFDGQRDGMNAVAFWKHCLDKGPTITFCESQSGEIFGGYTPCKWVNDFQWQQDDSMTSFLFSITKQQIYPLKQKEYVICGNYGQGSTFGGGFDLYIEADFQSGYSKLGHSYDTSQYQITDPKTHLFGGRTPALKNIEVYFLE